MTAGIPQGIAGCGEYGKTRAVRLSEHPPRKGELGLPMFVQYTGGSISYTLTPPSEPCQGPSCRAHHSMKPFGTLAITVRLNLANSCFDTISATEERDQDRAWTLRPDSEFAGRGSVGAPEHPPKFM